MRQVIGLLSVGLVKIIMDFYRIFQGKDKLLKKNYYEFDSLEEIVYKGENPAR